MKAVIISRQYSDHTQGCTAAKRMGMVATINSEIKAIIEKSRLGILSSSFMGSIFLAP
jgi:hypothetical protein